MMARLEEHCGEGVDRNHDDQRILGLRNGVDCGVCEVMPELTGLLAVGAARPSDNSRALCIFFACCFFLVYIKVISKRK